MPMITFLLVNCTSLTIKLWLHHALCDVCLVLCCSVYARVGDGSVGHWSMGHMGRHYSMGHMGHGSVGADP